MVDVKRRDLDIRWSELKDDRASWLSHWRELSNFILPRTGRFLLTDTNRGNPKHNHIIDNTGTRALRTLGAGMMSGMTSPARPWLRLVTPDPDLNMSQAVKIWLADCTRLMEMVFARSNIYRALHSTYEELGTYGTSAKVLVPDYTSVVHCFTLTAGEYAIATDYKGQPNTLYREFRKTVAEVVAEFGLTRCSDSTQAAYRAGNLGVWVDLMHCIEPRSDRDPSKRDNKNMPWRSVYYEQGARNDQVLREGGFQEFPGLVSRWVVSGGDIYGSSPGMEALGDIKQLQHQQRRKGEAIDYKTRPPIIVPAALKNTGADFLPGGVSYADMTTGAGSGAIRSAFEVNLDLSHMLSDMQDVRERIRGAFYADLFLMLSTIDHTGMTATEIAERHEEKLLMLGPVVERLHTEELIPLVEGTFAHMASAGILPPAPEELQGVNLQVEFISTLAQAQRAVGLASIDRFVANLGTVATMKPGVLDKFDSDEWADVYADRLGVDPAFILSNEKVAVIRQQREAAAQQQAQQQAMAQAAQTANVLGNTPTGSPNALTDIAGAFATAQTL